MRTLTLTDKQHERVREFTEALPTLWHRPYIDAEDLNDIGVDGYFSLEHLRALVALLTTCEQELLDNSPESCPTCKGDKG